MHAGTLSWSQAEMEIAKHEVATSIDGSWNHMPSQSQSMVHGTQKLHYMNMGHQCFARAPVPPTYSARRYEYMQERPPCLTAVGLDQPGTEKMAWRCRPHEPKQRLYVWYGFIGSGS